MTNTLIVTEHEMLLKAVEERALAMLCEKVQGFEVLELNEPYVPECGVVRGPRSCRYPCPPGFVRMLPLSREILECELGRLRVQQCMKGEQNSLDLLFVFAAHKGELADEVHEFGDESVEFAAAFFRFLDFWSCMVPGLRGFVGMWRHSCCRSSWPAL
mmetsp:Transcript_67810/g.220769  ORF Transcript_67810/g.220769 Transcript_67810/m.220769 type:complete len:158 (+) Transcript_67810:629-1102(+)